MTNAVKTGDYYELRTEPVEFKLPKLLDGAMGTMLQKAGMKPGTIPETLNVTDPEMVAKVQRAYIRAGSRAIYANTFGANRYKTAASGYSVEALISAGKK